MGAFDPRWGQLAEILVDYSTRVKPGDKALITMMEVETFPLTLAVYELIAKRGAYPQVQFASAYLEKALMEHGSKELLEWVPDQEVHGMQWADVYFGLRGARNPYEFASISGEKLAAHKRAMGQVSALRNESTRWVLVRVPNESLAQAAGMSLSAMMDFFFMATLRDWSAEVARYDEIRTVFQSAKTVHIEGAGTNLTMSTAGRTWVIGDGSMNMPDGEIFTAPVDDSAEGTIFFEFPATYAGVGIEGIRLEFKNGEVVSASADRNGDFLQQVLAIDDGARRLGELGIGTNFGIDRFIGDLLYDEKIGGTCHLALGRAYPACGGTNQSSIHWDLVKDLRTEGAIRLDGEVVFEKGRFLF